METPEDPELSVGWAVASAGARCAAWWLLWGGTVALGLRLRHSRQARGWTLYKIILLVLTALALKMTTYLAYAAAFRAYGDSSKLVSRLYYLYTPFSELGQAAFLGLLLLLASGFCITRADMGEHKAKVIGIPSILFVTGVVTDVIYYQFTDSVSDEVDFLDMAPWEESLWFVCTLLNVACLVLAWVYAFDIIEQETKALEAQEAANTRPAAGANSGAEGEAAGAAPHAAAPTDLDEALALEGTVAYKQLAAPAAGGAGAAHVAGADVEAQEFETVADKINFEIKKKLYKSFTRGVAAYLIATFGVLLLPVFMNVVIQGLVVYLQFLVQFGLMAGLVWIFRPVEDSPYLMIGGSLEQAEELGITDLGTALGGLEDEEEAERDRALAVELGALAASARHQRWREAAAAAGKPAEPQQRQQLQGGPGGGALAPAAGGPRAGDAGGGGRWDQSGGGGSGLPVSSAAADLAVGPPPGLPPVRTRLPDPSGPPRVAAAAAPAAAVAAPPQAAAPAGGGGRFTLGGAGTEDRLDSIEL